MPEVSRTSFLWTHSVHSLPRPKEQELFHREFSWPTLMLKQVDKPGLWQQIWRLSDSDRIYHLANINLQTILQCETGRPPDVMYYMDWKQSTSILNLSSLDIPPLCIADIYPLVHMVPYPAFFIPYNHCRSYRSYSQEGQQVNRLLRSIRSSSTPLTLPLSLFSYHNHHRINPHSWLYSALQSVLI